MLVLVEVNWHLAGGHARMVLLLLYSVLIKMLQATDFLRFGDIWGVRLLYLAETTILFQT